MFVYYPALLFENVTAVGMLAGLISSLIGVVCLATSSIGYLFGQLDTWQRLALFAGVILVMTSLKTDIAGLVIIASIIAVQLRREEN